MALLGASLGGGGLEIRSSGGWGGWGGWGLGVGGWGLRVGVGGFLCQHIADLVPGVDLGLSTREFKGIMISTMAFIL